MLKRLQRNILSTFRNEKLCFHFGQGTFRNRQKMFEFQSRLSCVPFGNIRRNRNHGTPDLTC